MKVNVDSFAPGSCISSLQLKAKVLNQQYAPELEYLVILNGAREPNNQFLVEVSLPRTTRGVSILHFLHASFCLLPLCSLLGGLFNSSSGLTFSSVKELDFVFVHQCICA